MTKAPVSQLTVFDNCDRCGPVVRAVVRWAKEVSATENGVIDLCGSHSHRYGANLIAQGWAVADDQTASLLPAPSAAGVQ